MASIAIAGIGAAIGGAGTTAIIGSMLLAEVGYLTTPDQKGPQLKDLQPPNSRIGETIPKGFGTTPSVGTIIWATDKIEHAHKEKQGKGGGPTNTTYSYSGSFTVSLGMGPITRIAKIMLNQKTIYDYNGGAPIGDTDYLGKKSGGDYFSNGVSTNGKVRIRLGTETQMPDSAEEADKGVGNCSAYRGVVTLTGEDLDLAEFGNTWPQVTVLLNEPTHSVAKIAEWIVKAAGLTEEEFDFCEIYGIDVLGFVLPQQQAASAYLSQLGVLANCDFVERDWKLRAIKRGRPATLVIPRGDLQCHDEGSELPDFKPVRADELTMPKEVSVSFIDSSRNYTTSSSRAWRETDGPAGAMSNIDLSNAVILDSQARSYADIALYTTLAQRTSIPLSLPGHYAYLDDADTVKVETDSGEKHVVLQSSQQSLFGSVTFAAASYRKSANSYPLAENTAGQQPHTVLVGGEYYFTAIDTNLLADNVSTAPLLLLAITSPEGSYFKPLNVFSSYFSASQKNSMGNAYLDLGNVWNPDSSSNSDNQFNPGSVSINAPSNMGEVVGTLGAYPYGAGVDPGSFDLIDDVNTLTVDMIRGTLSSLTDEQFMYQTQGRENTYIVGREIVKVRTWTYIGTFSDRKRYAGTGIYRGRRGTEWYSDQHTATETFVDVTGSLYYAQMRQGAIGQSIVINSGDPDAAPGPDNSLSLMFYGNTLKPYSPHFIRAERDGSGNITILGERRSRMSDNAWWQTGIPPVLGEAAELYDIEIIKPGGTVARTFSNLSSISAAYSTAQQADDLGAVSGAVRVRVYQRSAIVGRGYVAEAII